MCFGGGSKAPSAPAAPAIQPAPAPAPMPQPSEISPQTAEQKRAKSAALRYGMLSTIKTGGQGTTGSGPDLITPTATAGKKTLGS